MDGLLYNTDNLDAAQIVAQESVQLLASRGFKLVKWTACKKAKSIIPEMDENNLAPLIRTVDLKTEEPLPDFKAVGCIWNAEEDTLTIHFSLSKPQHYTRRMLLSQLASHYDSLGYCAPLFLKGRIILQRLTLERKLRDELVSHHDVKAWNRWLATLDVWKDLTIPKWYFADSAFPDDDRTSSEYELHVFSDVSNEAYGSVVYLRKPAKNLVGFSFVIGKSRVVLKHQ